MRLFSHFRILSVFVIVLFATLSLSAIWLSWQQRDLLRAAARQQAEHDLDLMVDTSVEALIKSDFVTVRTFVERWGATHHEYHLIKFIAPNGYVLAEYQDPAKKPDPTYAFTKDVTIAGTTAATAHIEVYSSNSETIADQLQKRLLLQAFIVTSMLGVALWMVIRKMALEPLEAAVKKQTRALSDANAVLAKEIGERKTAQMALQQREERLTLILHSMGEGIFGVDTEGYCTFCNPAALRLLGYQDQRELIGKNMHTLIHHTRLDGTPLQEEECKIYRCFRHGIGAHVDDEFFFRADGSSFAVEYWSQPIINNGTMVGAVTAFLDISERREMQERLQQAQKMESIGTLAGGIAHDFNNILSAVIGYTDLALMQTKDLPTVKDNLLQVQKAADRATDLVKQILTFSRKQPQEKLRLQIAVVIKEALKLLRASLPASIEIRQDITAQGSALADPTQIHQLVMNLCTNASHAMTERGGVLGVSLKEVDIDSEGVLDNAVELTPGPYLKLSVSDTGCGMSKETAAKIFEPYFTTKEKGRGTGLGLAVVHGIVKGHQGRITVYSEPGKGSTFNIYLPMVPHHEAAETVSQSPPPMARAHERIMVVDDEEPIRNMTSQFLTQAGYRVEVFTNGIEAWQTFQQRPEEWDLLLTDQTMPGMNGATLAAKALQLKPRLPIILCSGYSEILDAKGLQALGGSAFLQKPISIKALLTTVAEALSGKRQDDPKTTTG